MPQDQSSAGRPACHPGQIGSSQEHQNQNQHQYHYHRNEKTKSTLSYAQHPRRKSSKDDAAVQLAANIGATQTRRPSAKGRAHSAPLVPKSGPLPPADDDEAEAGSSFLDADPGPDDDDDDEDGDNDILDDDEEEIADDPFFQRFSFAHATTPDDEPPSPDSHDSSTDNEGPLSPTSMQMRARPDSTAEPLGSPLTPRGTMPWSESTSPRMEEINIAVLGASTVGKSTFIQRAFDLQTTPTSPFTLRKMSIDGNVYLVRLIELAYDDLNLDEHKRICWPDTIDGTPLPVIDGAFTLYDVMSRESLAQVPETLSGIYKASIPFILVACKCDIPPARRHVDPMVVDHRAKAVIGDITAFQTSCTAPDSQKRCIAVLLRAIVSVRNQHLHLAAARRRAHSSAVRHVPRQQGPHKHSRAASELPASMMRGPTTSTAEPSNGLATKSRSQQNLPDAIPNAQRQRHDFDKTSDTDRGDADQSANPDPEDTQLTPKISQTDDGVTFEALVDRLLAQPMSKSDNKFQAIFLALYRKFAAPCQLLDGIIERFDEIAADDLPQITKAHHQLRHLNILEQWISQYPGDFAYPTTRKALEKFISRIRQVRLYSVAARELQANLDVSSEDDDTDWAFSDRTLQRARLVGDGLSKEVVGLAISDDDPPLSPKSGRSPSASTSTSSSQAMLNIVESASRQARQLTPSPKVALSKIQWRSFMEHPDDVIAKELTRQDWTIFTSIRPRDLIRHVSLSANDKKKYRSLSNVQGMIDHFNHISYMCTNLILLRDKPKHRALMLEKVMRVARELRKLNNYNSLGAILAGVNSSAVHRLSATKDLIPKDVHRDFMKLEILMGSQKSHFAYRLAWENTPGERIPYLPLHRRDLVSASEGNRTFIGVDSDQEMEERWLAAAASSSSSNGGKGDIVDGDIRINWKKFEILGEGIVSIQRAQRVPYPRFQVCDEVRSLVVDTEIIRDDDQLHDRSVALEPAGAAGGPLQKRRFQWFQGASLAMNFPQS